MCVPDSFLGAETSSKEKLGNQLNADHGQLFNIHLSINANEPITVKLQSVVTTLLLTLCDFCVHVITLFVQ